MSKPLDGSGLGERSTWPGASDYSATKGAIALYSRAWARDLASRDIAVNVVQPGPVVTDMNPDTGDFAEMELKLIPLGRFGRLEEISTAVAFIAGPGTSLITGVALNVDGGLAAEEIREAWSRNGLVLSVSTPATASVLGMASYLKGAPLFTLRLQRQHCDGISCI
ncbi:Cyclic-di-GMP-binding biofilm dispersal mediator protein [Burkholderia sp. AD24]|nr:Cyclic-di-GMP-binding biofilm dispersal mediator protein [Burkholderia sp. AD24]